MVLYLGTSHPILLMLLIADSIEVLASGFWLLASGFWIVAAAVKSTHVIDCFCLTKMPVASFRVSSSVKLHLKLRQLQHQRSALSFLEDKFNTPSSKNNAPPKKYTQHSPLQIRIRDGHSLIKPHSIGGVDEHLQGSSLSEPWLPCNTAKQNPIQSLDFLLRPGCALKESSISSPDLSFSWVTRRNAF